MAETPDAPHPRSGEQPPRSYGPSPDAGVVPSARVARDPGVQASPADFGGQTGAATAGIGAVTSDLTRTFIDAQARLQERADSIARAQEENAFKTAWREKLVQYAADPAVSSPKSLQALGVMLGNETNAAIEKHGGSGASKAKFAVRMENLRNELSAQAAVTSHNALIGEQESALKEVRAAVVDGARNGNNLDADLAMAFDEIENRGGGLPGFVREAKKKEAAETAVVARVEPLLDAGGLENLKGARDIMARKDIKQLLGAEAYGKLNSRIIIADRTMREQGLENKLGVANSIIQLQEQRSGALETLFKVQNERLRLVAEQYETAQKASERLRQLEGRETKLEAAEKVASAEQKTRMEEEARKAAERTTKFTEQEAKLNATLAEIEKKIAQFDHLNQKALSPFEAASFAAQYADDYGKNLLNPAFDARYRAAVDMILDSSGGKDPTTGQDYPRSLSPDMTEALRRRGEWNDELSLPSWRQPREPWRQAAGQAQAGSGAAPTVAGSPDNDVTAWDAAESAVGTWNTIGLWASRMGPVGAFVAPTEMVRKTQVARTKLGDLENAAVRGVMGQGKFANQYREEIKGVLGVLPNEVVSLFRAPSEVQNRIEALDAVLRTHIREAINILKPETVATTEEKKDALDVKNAALNLRARLRVPPQFKTPDEAWKAVDQGLLKKGDKYRTPDGFLKEIK